MNRMGVEGVGKAVSRRDAATKSGVCEGVSEACVQFFFSVTLFSLL